MADWMKELSVVLTGAKVTFSRNCCSGLVGEKCQCWRCREHRQEPVTPDTEAEAERISKAAQSAMRARICAALAKAEGTEVQGG